MNRKKLALFASSIAAAISMAQATAFCVQTPESNHTIVRGQFVRCEDAASYLQVNGISQRYERDLEIAIERVGEEHREELMRRLQESPSSPFNKDFEAHILVIAVDWQASIAPWIPGASSSVEFKEEPHEFQGTMQYWWRGPIQTCEQMTALSPLDLWVSPECCDTVEFAAPVCIVEMDYADLAPVTMSGALTLAIEGA